MDQLMRRSPRRGFTMLELMITLSVAAVGVLAMVTMQIQAVKDGSKGRHRTGAAMIARDQVELIQSMPFSDAGLGTFNPANWATPPWLGNGGDVTLNAGEIPVTVTQSSGPDREIVYTVWYLVTPANDSAPNTDLRRIDLEVTWTEPSEAGVLNDKPTRTGFPTVAVSTVLVDNDR